PEPAGRAGDQDRGHQATPPFAYRTWPLTHRAGPARNATTSAMSDGRASRSSGGAAAARSMASCELLDRNRSAAVGPGATALTVMSRPRSSRARINVIVSTAPLLEPYAL